MKKKVWIWISVIVGILVIASTGTYLYAKTGTETVGADEGVMSISIQRLVNKNW